MKKLLMRMVWLTLGFVIGSALEATVGRWIAVVILFVVLCIALWNLVRRGEE